MNRPNNLPLQGRSLMTIYDGFRCATATMAILVGVAAVSSASTNDRVYLLGDDPFEGASLGGSVTTTFDSAGQSGQNQLVDLTAVNSPTYVPITGRPDGGGGVGIEFDGSQSEYLRTDNLGFPEISFSSVGSGVGTINYTGIADRGFQFWVQPAAGVSDAQSLVMDTNQHGARITDSGVFSMRYAGVDYDSTVTATPGTWFHVMVVRPDTAANGARLYVNGVAAAAAPGGYDDDFSDLVVGSNTGGDSTTFTGGTEEFFSGIIDDLEMFVIGVSDPSDGEPPAPPVDFGAFDFATDNAFAEFSLSGVLGDLDNDSTFDVDDRDAFISGWMSTNEVNGLVIGDLNSYSLGDINFDGVTDIFDLAEFQSALRSSGLPVITAAELSAVPEPSSVILLAGLAGACWSSRRRR